jgi:flagellar biosynthesis protein
MGQEPRRLKAVALRYKAGEDAAPRIAAKGQGSVADKILHMAKQHDIPIREDRNLLQMLTTLDLDQEIPPSVYRAVAEILAFLYRLSNRSNESAK